MKKILSTVILATTLALTACGGGSSSSSGTNHQTNKPQKEIAFGVEKTLANDNVYKCYSQHALDSCTDDNTCGVAKCTLVKGTPPALTLPNCETQGNTFWGKKGESCQFSVPDFDNGKPKILECDAQGKTIFKSDINGEGLEAEQLPSKTGAKFLRCE